MDLLHEEEEDVVNAPSSMTLNNYAILSKAAAIADTDFPSREANEPFAISDGPHYGATAI